MTMIILVALIVLLICTAAGLIFLVVTMSDQDDDDAFKKRKSSEDEYGGDIGSSPYGYEIKPFYSKREPSQYHFSKKSQNITKFSKSMRIVSDELKQDFEKALLSMKPVDMSQPSPKTPDVNPAEIKHTDIKPDDGAQSPANSSQAEDERIFADAAKILARKPHQPHEPADEPWEEPPEHDEFLLGEKIFRGDDDEEYF